MARQLGINPMTATEEQGYSKKRLEDQLIGTLPPVTKICTTTGRPYLVYPRDPNHPRWKKKATRIKSTETFTDIELAA
jgi:hypothetical protein